MAIYGIVDISHLVAIGQSASVKALPRLALVVTKRPHDYHCALAGNSAVWDCGKTVQEAVGAWVLAHGKDYGVAVEVD